jgi:hypothetical protein
MNNMNDSPKRGKGGRPQKTDPAAKRLTVNLTDAQHARFMAMYEQSGVATQSAFIAARIFGDEFRVVKTDGAAAEFVSRLTAIHGQIRSIGVNYNQIVRQLHTTFGVEKGMKMLYRVEQLTIELSRLTHEVLLACNEFRAKVG